MRGDIGLFLGLVAVIGGVVIVAVIVLVGDDGDGGGNNPCDNPLPPIGDETEISELTFQAEDKGLDSVIQAALEGSVEAAVDAFLFANNAEVHNFTHNVDAPLRRVNEDVARGLCQAVIRLEEELPPFSAEPNAERIAIEAGRLQEFIRDAAEALGFARPGE